jgi:tetratricopeptide (TPR) repeat protein/predicted Ser/Thr protein kinase
MTPDQWTRVKEVFHAALAQEPSGRRTFVSEASGGDEAVRAEVERLLDADDESSAFLEFPAADTLLRGRVLGHYEIERLLGAGGMGRVYAARDTQLGRDVALKVAPFDSQDAQSRLVREAQHASRLSHPHICHIYDVGRADDRPFVVMERVPGKSLAEVLREGPLPVEQARRYGAEIADALAHAHEQGVTHRDLKSTNVMITPKRGAKVLDFGLARMLDTHQIDALSQSQRSLTGEGMIAGTLPYLAPELLRGRRGDQRADIWALGVLLYEMVSGRRPFTGSTGFELSAAILHQPPEALPATVPGWMSAVITRCLEKDPGLRYQQASDVYQALSETAAPTRISPTGVSLPRLALPRVRAIARRRYVTLGMILLVVGVGIAALALYGIAPAIPPEMFNNARGYSLLQAGDFQAALEEFEGVAEREPDESNPWDSLGEGYLANGMAEKALDAYSRALAIEPTFSSSILGRGLSLAALGRYDEAFERDTRDYRIQAVLLSRVGRYREAEAVLDGGRREALDGGDAEGAAASLVVSGWLMMERGQHVPALAAVGAADTVLATDDASPTHTLRVFSDLLAGMAEIRAGKVSDAASRLAARKTQYDASDRAESNWVLALEGEVALAQGEYDRAMSSFTVAQRPVWITLGRDVLGVFGTNPPSRDGKARVAIARGNFSAAIDEYRRLTATSGGGGPAALLEPRYVLALARLLEGQGDLRGARGEYERFLTLWSKADEGLPEVGEARQALARLPPR